jgi:hypothetical protein
MECLCGMERTRWLCKSSFHLLTRSSRLTWVGCSTSKLSGKDWYQSSLTRALCYVLWIRFMSLPLHSIAIWSLNIWKRGIDAMKTFTRKRWSTKPVPNTWIISRSAALACHHQLNGSKSSVSQNTIGEANLRWNSLQRLYCLLGAKKLSTRTGGRGVPGWNTLQAPTCLRVLSSRNSCPSQSVEAWSVNVGVQESPSLMLSKVLWDLRGRPMHEVLRKVDSR